jgi:UDP-N-acetyl-2-amino-2-deoxyglucuronate dehydrogenase
MSKNFAIIGCAGYIAPRHLDAIKNTGNNLVAALDKSDSVGILDKYSKDIKFFTEFERFDRHLEKLKRQKNTVDWVSICSPNYLHDAHIRFAFRIGANAICEKPLVLNPWNLDALSEMEKETGKRVFSILQLRLHPDVIKLKEKIDDIIKKTPEKKFIINLNYITPRGQWYYNSWKGDEEKSGGIITNIGIHLFDMLLWIFGNYKYGGLSHRSREKVNGYLELEKASVKWMLSLDEKDILNGKNSCRSIKIDNEEFTISEDVFKNLHTLSYEKILNGEGFGIEDVKPSINLVYNLRKIR